MTFSDTFQIYAFPAEMLDHLPGLIHDYGVDGMDGKTPVRTIAAGWDDTEHTRKRPLQFPTTASLTQLTDGRLAYKALWSNPILNAMATDPRLAQAEELTEAELEQLRYVPEVDL